MKIPRKSYHECNSNVMRGRHAPLTAQGSIVLQAKKMAGSFAKENTKDTKNFCFLEKKQVNCIKQGPA